ncbi:LuxR C-terminal-related transcriptional regulator [Solitalea canadensis]|uniref:Response regulator containing a CheY-like receiver domain and an HTH DNA-binding domain n=1 Tax=Solitalea canadensis (strain ATCC 29591 / DSM 3403 / JCM 21819 / LMG 8368 / NBRC 15130 / NCIMB 12057 / USAM 9D) TaxID=929556 RepID=H8KXE2_SOLCM|nr:LuxR C-terminal-related transcriptional regulator [Solitalea canadensis]AFD08471.1 response regulator containing a CheY-like receiver domain and an HTH DNA-binding domain [Solitalea canadensis DSM 3403]
MTNSTRQKLTALTKNAALANKLAALQAIDIELPTIFIVHDLNTMTVEYMSPRGEQFLGFTVNDLKSLGSEYFSKFFNPDDVADYLPKVLSLLHDNDNDEKLVCFFQQARASEKHEWKWFLSSTKIFLRNEQNVPSHIITNATPIDPQYHITSKVNRLLQEKDFLKKNEAFFNMLTKREIEILRLIALGKNSIEIAFILHISEKTVVTHRRNLRSKLNVQTSYDITKFAQAFDLI